MEVERIFSDTINIDDIDTCCYDIPAYLMSNLHTRYVNKCRNKLFVLDILEIIQHSACKIMKTNLSAHGYIDVKFKVLGYQFEIGDILDAVEVKSQGGLVYGTSKINTNADAVCENDWITKILQDGQLVSIISNNVKFENDYNKITISGNVLTCNLDSTIYSVDDIITKKFVVRLDPLLERIKSLLEIRNKIFKASPEILLFIENHLYAYNLKSEKSANTITTKKYPDWNGPKNGKSPKNTLNIIEYLDKLKLKDETRVTGLFYKDINLYTTSPLIIHESENSKIDPKNIIHSTSKIVLTTLLYNIYKYLQSVNNMCMTYNTPELRKSHKNIWIAMKSKQLLI